MRQTRCQHRSPCCCWSTSPTTPPNRFDLMSDDVVSPKSGLHTPECRNVMKPWRTPVAANVTGGDRRARSWNDRKGREMPAYFVTEIEITNEAGFAPYRAAANATLE